MRPWRPPDRSQAGLPKAHEYLFVQRSGKPLARRLVENVTDRWGEAAGVPACLPHRFRHSYVTKLLENGVDRPRGPELLGHEDIK